MSKINWCNIDFEKLSDFLLSTRKSLDKLEKEKIEELREKIRAL